MKTFIVLSALVAFASCTGNVQIDQSTDGQYSFRYTIPGISRTEQRFIDGKTIGTYSYVDNAGINHEIRFLAAPETGYQAQGTDIPVPVQDTQEVIRSRAEHFAAVAKESAQASQIGGFVDQPVNVHQVLASLRIPEIARLPNSAVPAEGAEILSAKAEVLSAYSQAIARLAEEYRRSGGN